MAAYGYGIEERPATTHSSPHMHRANLALAPPSERRE
jgi:hypothetical protein